VLVRDVASRELVTIAADDTLDAVRRWLPGADARPHARANG
jgi:hypothetical protein